MAKAYHHGNLKEALIEAAAELLRETGPAEVTLRAAARRAGVSHAAPYRHFADKTALLAAVSTRGFGLLRDRLLKAAGTARAGVRERIGTTGEAYVRFAREHPHDYGLMFGPLIPESRQYDELRLAGKAAFQVLCDLVAEGQNEGVVIGGDPVPMALFAWATVHGLAQLTVDGQLGPAGTAETATDVARLVVRGLEKR